MKTRFLLLSMTLLLLTQTSCIFDNDIPCGSEDPDLLVINLNLTVPSSSTGTRSAGDALVPGSKDENYINIDGDYQVLLFDKDGNLVENKLSEFKCKENGVNGGGMTSYTLTTRLSLSGNEDKVRLSKFKVMVLANWESFENSNTKTGFKYPPFAGYSVSGTTNNIYKDGENFNFTLKDQGDTWVPSIENKQAIPMFGITEEVDLQFAIDMSKYGDGPSFNVPMLRSLAKIEIVDMVPDGKKANIEKCVLTKYNTSGRFIPDITGDNAKWNNDDFQILQPSLPEGVASSTNLQFVQTTKTVRTEGATADEDKACFVVYIPEMEIDKTDSPIIQVQLGGSDHDYPIYLQKYENGKPKDGDENKYDYLLRNHIYRFNITNVGIDMELTITTDHWDVDDDQLWDYEDAEPKFDEAFTWNDYAGKPWGTDESTGKFDTYTDINDMYRVLLIGSSAETAAYGYFNLSTPADNNPGTWTIALVPDDGTNNDHFKIEVMTSPGQWESQGQGDSYTASIGDDPVEFRIMATDTNGSATDYTARVVMVVKTFDGRLVNIPLRSKYDRFPNYITDPNESGFYFMVKQLTNGGDNM